MFSVEFYKLKHNATSFHPYLKTVQLRVCRFCLLRHCYAKIFLVAVFFFIHSTSNCVLFEKEGGGVQNFPLLHRGRHFLVSVV